VIISYFLKSFFIIIIERRVHLDALDLMKAYNLVRWDFLLAILRTVGFPSRMVN
jgi:hypothetical protein